MFPPCLSPARWTGPYLGAAEYEQTLVCRADADSSPGAVRLRSAAWGFSLLLGEWFLWVLGSQRAGLCHREWQRTRTELQLLLESRGHTYLVFCLLGGSLIALGMVNGTGSSKHRWGWGQVLGRGWALGQGVRRCWPISTPVLTLLTHPSYVSPGWTPQLCGASWGGGNFFFPVHTTDLAGLGSGLGNFWVLFLLLYVVGRQRKDKELTFAWGINHR